MPVEGRHVMSVDEAGKDSNDQKESAHFNFFFIDFVFLNIFRFVAKLTRN